MSRYDFSEATHFLNYELDVTPGELREEIEDAMCELEPGSALWHTLLTVADFLERIKEKLPA